MKEETFRLFNGMIVGSTRMSNGYLCVYDFAGRCLGKYDGTYTYDFYGRKVGSGNLLVLFLADKFDLSKFKL